MAELCLLNKQRPYSPALRFTATGVKKIHCKGVIKNGRSFVVSYLVGTEIRNHPVVLKLKEGCKFDVEHNILYDNSSIRFEMGDTMPDDYECLLRYTLF